MKVEHHVFSIDKIVDHIAQGFTFKNGTSLARHDFYYDPQKGKVVFILYINDPACSEVPDEVKTEKTERGFTIIRFDDFCRAKCSIQKSSLTTDDVIWLGIDDPTPVVLASDAKALGIETTETTGWINYPIPDQVFMTTRMHLNRGQVRDLIQVLTRFADTGDI